METFLEWLSYGVMAVGAVLTMFGLSSIAMKLLRRNRYGGREEKEDP
jgi:hypothetical protein